jgi:hypothetical protein
MLIRAFDDLDYVSALRQHLVEEDISGQLRASFYDV